MAPAPGGGGTGAPETAAPCADAIPAWAAINTDKILKWPRNDISCVFDKDDLPGMIPQATSVANPKFAIAWATLRANFGFKATLAIY